ncbi:MAG: DNA methyltransferase, partial [Candidatus Fimivivens sp.]
MQRQSSISGRLFFAQMRMNVAAADLATPIAKENYEVRLQRQSLVSVSSVGGFTIRTIVRGQLGVWTWSLDKFNENKNDIIVTGKSGSYALKKRTFVPKEVIKVIDGKPQFIDYTESNVRSIWDFSTNDGTKMLNDLMEESNTFNNAKNLEMIKNLISLVPDKDSIIFDFFSGSATTAHAVVQLNAEDGGHRRFICVQLPEVCDENSEAAKSGYSNICEIGKERIRRAGRKLLKADDQIQQSNAEKAPPDIGFRCFKLDT